MRGRVLRNVTGFAAPPNGNVHARSAEGRCGMYVGGIVGLLVVVILVVILLRLL